ncbi:hypothetical protein GCM10022225_16860 [Plantactinospora mayteni]|uniref:Uncharacterized protein n=1 Tax=Plantactinospora mayteni TaxID=566021 RepID=A0ABQ4EGA1_9ACTN|nr:hypothetical protein [Plantactinospora mayteni]GIG93760.1 hypothetical protein Pma05_03330 [Plantactinospora mayteni]
MTGPSIWTVVLADPTVPFDRATLALVVADQRRPSRRWLYPVVRPLSRLAVTLIRIGKRLLPVPVSGHSAMDTLCVWFLRRFVSPTAGALLIRHFVVETNLLNFVVRNAAPAGVDEVTLRPTTLAGLGDSAVIEHDLNVYAVLTGLGLGGRSARPEVLDFSMLTVPAVDASPGVPRLARLDIQTALCLMNIPFALCLTDDEYRRAVHSLRLDDSLLAVLAELTGDATFLRWCSGTPAVRVDSSVDVPQAVYEHAVVCEYAHERLRQLAARQEPAPHPDPAPQVFTSG